VKKALKVASVKMSASAETLALAHLLPETQPGDLDQFQAADSSFTKSL